MLLLIDNYDSFVHNLSRYLTELGCETQVARNDAISVADIEAMNPAALILSPGPCTPNEAGICVDAIKTMSGKIPLLGVCLGHQAIGSAFGAAVVRANEPVHGRTSRIYHDGEHVFAGLPNPMRAMRYHSLIIDESTLPDELSVIARTSDGTPMAVAHRSHLTIGTQFHPESVLTEHGHSLLRNFLAAAGIATSDDLPAAEWTPENPNTDDWPVVPF